MLNVTELCGFGVGEKPTILLLKFDGTDGSTTITDEIGHTVTASGNAHIENTQSVYGGTSLQLDGSGDYLTVTNASDLMITSQDFTIDVYVRLTAIGLIEFLGRKGYEAANNAAWQLYMTSSGVNFYGSSDGTTPVGSSASYSFSTNTWYHIAVVKTGTSAKIYVDGTLAGTVTVPAVLYSSTADITIGRNQDPSGQPSQDFSGYMDNFRISNGALWNGDFTVPSEAEY